MTSQTKHYIDLSDIAGLRFKCNQCGAELSVDLTKEIRERAINYCPNCHEEWVLAGSSSYFPIFADFIKNLNRLRGAIESPQSRIGFTLKAEIKEDASALGHASRDKT